MSHKTVMDEMQYHADELALLGALNKCAEAMGTKLMESDAPAEPLPDLMESLYRRKRRSVRIKRGVQRGVNVLAACMALVIFGSILAFVCSADVRGFLFREIVSFGDGFISFQPEELPDELKPGYLPWGYICIDSTKDDLTGTYIANFSNGTGGTLSLSIEQAETNNIYDYEEDIPADSEIVSINGADGYYWSRGEVNLLAWLQGGHFYSLIGSVSKEEMLKVARSM